MANPPDNETQRLENFALKVHALVQSEEVSAGLSGTLLGYSIGFMRRHGATEEEVRNLFDQVLARVFTLPITNSNPFHSGEPS